MALTGLLPEVRLFQGSQGPQLLKWGQKGREVGFVVSLFVFLFPQKIAENKGEMKRKVKSNSPRSLLTFCVGGHCSHSGVYPCRYFSMHT